MKYRQHDYFIRLLYYLNLCFSRPSDTTPGKQWIVPHYYCMVCVKVQILHLASRFYCWHQGWGKVEQSSLCWVSLVVQVPNELPLIPPQGEVALCHWVGWKFKLLRWFLLIIWKRDWLPLSREDTLSLSLSLLWNNQMEIWGTLLELSKGKI